jgi:protein-S-isoprenylcysteine O-methyltransferase Ste14
MDELLSALGRRICSLNKIWIFSLFIITTACFLLMGHIGCSLFRLNAVIWHIIAWGGWFIWQGWLFPYNRKHLVKEFSNDAYRKAFYKDILPGVSFGVSQMARPFFYTLLTESNYTISIIQLLVSILLLISGSFMLYSGFKAIGIARAGFLYEYLPNTKPLIKRGIYLYIRHPLFLGGVILSIGACLFFNKLETFFLVIINVAILPIYRFLEDNRSIRIFGESYKQYKSTVGAFIPKLNRLQN